MKSKIHNNIDIFNHGFYTLLIFDLNDENDEIYEVQEHNLKTQYLLEALEDNGNPYISENLLIYVDDHQNVLFNLRNIERNKGIVIKVSIKTIFESINNTNQIIKSVEECF